MGTVPTEPKAAPGDHRASPEPYGEAHKRFRASDVAVLSYAILVGGVAAYFRVPGLPWYLLGHSLVILGVCGVAIWDPARGPWRVLRDWYGLLVVLGAFREMHYLIPAVNPFEDHGWDFFLADLDLLFLGDYEAWLLPGLRPGTVDLLHLCYWWYFPSMVVPGVVIYRTRPAWVFEDYVVTILVGFFGSYLGYFLVPALGPYAFHETRPAILDGWLLGGTLHRALLGLELRMPDAFPSGHALMSGLVLVLVRRHLPWMFKWIVVPSLGCILATVVLRYHYAVDVAASALFLPLCLKAAANLEESWGNPREFA